jgi:Tfp pilus assembly protein PilV
MTKTRDGTSNSDGFVLIEVLVAFLLTTLGLIGLYSALGIYSRQVLEADVREHTLAHAQSHIDAIGLSIATGDKSTGVYPNGTTWTVTATTLAPSPGSPSRSEIQPTRIVLEAFDRRNRRLLQLSTIKLLPVPP